MKHSIKTRITLWYAALIVFICAAAVFSLLTISSYSQMTHCRETLQSASVVIMDEMEIEHGRIEIDPDIDDVPGVYAALFDLSGELVYGRTRVSLPFEEGSIRRAQDGKNNWMVLDTLLDVPEYEPVWLRVHMAADTSVYVTVMSSGLWLLPLLAVVALVGGYLITARAFVPVGEMSHVAKQIAQSGDLSGRVPSHEDAGAQDELYALAGTLNAMLSGLEAAFERERQFTSDAAHELRTPLNAMRTQGEYALSCEDAAQKDEAIAQMLDKNEEMQRLIAQLLLMARLDAGQTRMEDGVALHEIIATIAEDMEMVAEERSISVRTKAEEVFARADRSMIARAVINLVDNAIRYGKEGGEVRILLHRQGDFAEIAVADDGEGLGEEALEHVFERFWRADSARTGEGTGIGLAIVRSVANAHGGDVQAQSVRGEGSCFVIRIPCCQSKE